MLVLNIEAAMSDLENSLSCLAGSIRNFIQKTDVIQFIAGPSGCRRPAESLLR